MMSPAIGSVFSYLALPDFIDDALKPFQWYKDLVHCGMRYHRHPEDYVQRFEIIEAIDDSNDERIERHRQLIFKLESL